MEINKMIYEEKKFIVKNGLEISLKTPAKEEAKDLLDFIINVCDQTDFLLSTSADFKKMTVEGEENFLESYKVNKDCFIAVYIDGKIIGDCSVSFHTHIKDSHRGEIGITIDKEYWNYGIGSLLFDEMIRISEETPGIEQLELGVNSKNDRAKALYLKKGFEKVGAIPNGLKMRDGTYADEELMIKFIK